MPHFVLIDLDLGTMDNMRTRPFGHVFKLEYKFTFGQSKDGNNWAKGNYIEGD